MDAIARRLGVKARMVQYNWSNLVQSLERGDFDVVMNGLEATAERKDRILLSDPYYVYAETLTVRRGSDIKSVFELGGKRVGTLNQTFAHDILRMMPTIEPVLYEGNEEPYLDLEQGRSDAVLLDNIIADRYGCTDKHPLLQCVPYDVARGTYVVGIRKGDEQLQGRDRRARSPTCAQTASSSGSCARPACGTIARGPRRRSARPTRDDERSTARWSSSS